MGKYIPPPILDELKKVDLVTYFRTIMPYELVKASANEYTTKTHDSLRMSNGLWNWCSKGVGGKNAIDFIMKTKNMRFIDAANLLLDQMNLKQPIVIDKTIKSKEKHIIIPEKNTASDNVISYLKSRGIDEEIIKETFGQKTQEEYKEEIWKQIKEINKNLPLFKHIKKIEITTEELEKTTTQKVKRYKELQKVK